MTNLFAHLPERPFDARVNQESTVIITRRRFGSDGSGFWCLRGLRLIGWCLTCRRLIGLQSWQTVSEQIAD